MYNIYDSQLVTHAQKCSKEYMDSDHHSIEGGQSFQQSRVFHIYICICVCIHRNIQSWVLIKLHKGPSYLSSTGC